MYSSLSLFWGLLFFIACDEKFPSNQENDTYISSPKFNKSLKVILPTKLFENIVTKSSIDITLTPDWDNYSIHSSEIFVPIKYNIPVVLLQKTDTKITISKNVKSFLRYEKAKTKVGDEDPGMITIGEDSLSDDGFCGTIIYSTTGGTLIYSAVFINGILQYILQPADSPIPDSRVFYADYSVNTAQILSPVIGDKDYEWF